MKQKISNFWYYYKIHVFFGILILLFAIVLIKDMTKTVSYDYNIAFVGNRQIPEEEVDLLQEWFEKNAEDLNSDGEVHVQIWDYFLDEKAPQAFVINQTKFSADVQSGTSMIFFMNKENYEHYKDMGVFPENLEGMTAVKECQGFEEAGSPQSIQDFFVCMRSAREGQQEYYKASEKLFEEFMK